MTAPNAAALAEEARAEVAAAEQARAAEDRRLEYLAAFALDVEEEARRIRIREAARRKVRKEQERDYGNLDPIPLADFLAAEDESIRYRIDGLWPRGGRLVLAAQAKAGKTTLIGNVMRSILDGDLFLGRFQTEPVQGVVLLDFEMDDDTIRHWLRDQQIQNVAGATVMPLRGKASSFDILDPQTRSEWAKRLSGNDVILADCLRPILDALGLSEDKDAGRFLTAFDELLSEAGVSEALMVHHMGHTGERGRGDSRIIGWPDATWKMLRENPEDDRSARFFSAYGRGVNFAEDQLHYNPARRRLTLTGDGSRKQAQIARLRPPLMKLIKATPGLNGTALENALREEGVQFQKGDERKALADLVKLGLASKARGPRRCTTQPSSLPSLHVGRGKGRGS